MERLVIARSGLNLHEVRSGQLRQKDLDKIRSAASEVAESPIQIEDGESHLAPLAHKFRRWRQRNDLRMIVVDTLQDLRSDSARAVYSFEHELAEIAGFLKAIAVELNVPVLAFASLSGPPTDFRDGPPSLARIGNLWPILDHADVVANLCETDGSVPDHSHELHVLKQRYGPREKVDLHVDSRGLRFRDADGFDDQAGESEGDGRSVVVTEKEVFDS